MTNGEILKTFGEKYPKLRVKDYRPLCPELFTHHFGRGNNMVEKRGCNTVLPERSAGR